MKITAKQLMSLSAIPLSVYKASRLHSLFNPKLYDELFKKFNGTKKAFRIYIPYMQAAPKVREPEVPAEIVEFLKDLGWGVENYTVGIAIDKNGRRKKIGKLLEGNKELSRKFASDPHRQGSTLKSAKLLVCISRHPYDLAGMSFDRGWKSCTHLTEGENKHYLENDVKHGVLIAYLVDTQDKNINRPKARCRIYPFKNKAKQLRFIPEPTIYGVDDEGFKHTVDQWCDDVNQGSNTGIWTRPRGIYYDSVPTSIDIVSSFKDLLKACARRVDKTSIRPQIYGTQVLEEAIQFLKSDNVKYTQVLIQALIYVVTRYPGDQDLVNGLLKNPKLDEDLIDALLIFCKTLPPAFFEQFLTSELSYMTMSDMINHRSFKISPEKKLNWIKKNLPLSNKLLEKPPVTQEMLKVALSSPTPSVAATAYKYVDLTKTALWTAFQNSTNTYVREGIVSNVNFPANKYLQAFKQLDELNDLDLFIDKKDLSEKFARTLLTQALDDRDNISVANLLKHPALDSLTQGERDSIILSSYNLVLGKEVVIDQAFLERNLDKLTKDQCIAVAKMFDAIPGIDFQRLVDLDNITAIKDILKALYFLNLAKLTPKNIEAIDKFKAAHGMNKG